MRAFSQARVTAKRELLAVFSGRFFFPLLPWPVMGEFWVLLLLCCDKATCFMLEPLQAAVA